MKRIKINHFLVLINFWIETSTACQSVNQKFCRTSDFESHLSQSRRFRSEIVLRWSKIIGKLAFKKVTFWSFHPVKTSKFAFSCFLENWKKKDSEEKNMSENYFFRKKFQKSCFSNQFSLQRIRFQSKELKRVRF